MLEELFFIKSWLTSVHIYLCTGKSIDTETTGIQESLCLLPTNPWKSHISSINISCILRFAKKCTRENKDTTFDHKIAKIDTRENFRLYGMYLLSQAICPHHWWEACNSKPSKLLLMASFFLGYQWILMVFMENISTHKGAFFCKI